MTARRTYYNSANDIEIVEIDGHRISFGGPGGGYCYPHDSFDCLTNLSDDQKREIEEL